MRPPRADRRGGAPEPAGSDERFASVAREFLISLSSGDADRAVDLLHPDVGLCVGSAPGEWWEGRATIEPLVRAQLSASGSEHGEDGGRRERGIIEREVGDSDGTTAWAALRGLVRGVDAWFPFRITIVLRLVGESWRVVHWHFSEEVDPEVSFGTRLPTSIDEIAASLEQATPNLRAATPDGEVTLVFTDIESSTRQAASLGDQRWFAVLRQHGAALEAAAETTHGTIIKNLGDGYMLAFDTSAEAVRFARVVRQRLQEDDLGGGVRVRIGMHRGPAIHHDGDYFGSTVNFAARVAASAEGGQTVVSEAVRSALTADEPIEVNRLGSFRLRGIDGHHELFTLDHRADGPER